MRRSARASGFSPATATCPCRKSALRSLRWRLWKVSSSASQPRSATTGSTGSLPISRASEAQTASLPPSGQRGLDSRSKSYDAGSVDFARWSPLVYFRKTKRYAFRIVETPIDSPPAPAAPANPTPASNSSPGSNSAPDQPKSSDVQPSNESEGGTSGEDTSTASLTGPPLQAPPTLSLPNQRAAQTRA